MCWTYVVMSSVGVLLDGATDLGHGFHTDDPFDSKVRQVGGDLAVGCFSVRTDR